ncbi:MAG: molybdopterin synthase catalytic subunit MoaE [Cytophagales bacterium]|nr:molybdopterin synthase catalytic subunit MoaE [Cytophagales bacterium]
MISVQLGDFDVAAEYQALKQSTESGAVVIFSGLVRDMNLGESVGGLFLEHYPGMTEKSLEAIVEEARQRWPMDKVRVIHRSGQLQPGDQIVFVGTASAHRNAAFEACEFLMDYLKTRAPFWKRELTEEGERWVEAKDSDTQAAQRWEEGSRF